MSDLQGKRSVADIARELGRDPSALLAAIGALQTAGRIGEGHIITSNTGSPRDTTFVSGTVLLDLVEYFTPGIEGKGLGAQPGIREARCSSKHL